MGRSSFLKDIMKGRFTITDEFPIRPSWCDAELSLEQIKRGQAKGHRWALIVRSYLQTGLYALGSFIQKFDWAVLIVFLLIFCAWAIPLHHIVLETNIEKLWVPRGGRLESERDFMSSVRGMRDDAMNGEGSKKTEAAPPVADTSSTSELTGIQVLVQTTRRDNETILTREQLLKHVDVLLNISQLAVYEFGTKWTLEDICFKPRMPGPKGGSGDDPSDLIGGAMQSLVPCVLITPMDCFWEGSIPHGPFPPHDVLAGILSISWQSLDPQDLLPLLNQIKSFLSSGDFDTTDVIDIYQRAGITHAYQTLPCVDPLNKKCPKRAPNYIDVCDVVKRFLEWNDAHHEYPQFTRIMTTTKKPVHRIHDYDSFYDMDNNSTSEKGSGGGASSIFGGGGQEEPVECQTYSDNITQLMRENTTLAYLFIPNTTWRDYGKYLTGGCRGFAPNFMKWPEKLIFGGRQPNDGTIEKLNALQTVIMVATGDDVYSRFSGANNSRKSNLTNWNLNAAKFVIKQWQRKYAKTIYNWPNNVEGGSRILHALAAASITDMVEEFSQFNWSFIFVGYALMIAYACLSALSFARRGVRSCVGLAFCGCVLVIIANISGLGCTLLLGISFNATTTQILPFLLLSMGVDEMFLLLDKYREIIRKINHDEIGVLLRETGLSVLITYINNIVAFFAGVMLPIPALKVFCVQVAIVLIFNLIAVLTLYPAIMAIDLRRQRANRVDILCCIKWPSGSDSVAPQNNPTTTYGAASSPVDEQYEMERKMGIKNGTSSRPAPPLPPAPKKKPWYKRFTLTKFVRNFYAPVIQNTWVKIGLSMIFVVLFVASMVGLFRIPIGLELSELIPKDSPPYSFMLAREKYFPFYQIFMVVRGKSVNYGDMETQKLMRDYLDEIRNISYSVKSQLKNDWVTMMKDWLKYIEGRFQSEWNSGNIGPKGWTDDATKAAIIAYKLLCNKNGNVDCSQVTGNSTLIQSDGFIEPILFNKSVTAWFNADPMTYYVSQANFHPAPVQWEPKDKDSMEIPYAPDFWYTQIPLFIDGIVDTPATMDMIVKFRDVADKYTGKGLPTFPLGIPFTFWELYIYLKESVIWAFAIITAVVFAAISLMLLNPWISGLIVVVLLFMIIIELGFMGLINIKLNPISAVTLITAVGIRVKFTVHVALSFLTTVGSRNVRIARTLEHMFIPVLHGGVSTLLGLIMLAFCKFEFIVMYYFLIMFALVVLGMLGGLILMPVLLSWVGPPAEVIPLDGSDRLLPPVSTNRTSNSPQSPSGPTAGASFP